MSRVGKQAIKLDQGVEIRQEGQQVTVKGPKGTLELALAEGFQVQMEEGLLYLKPPADELKGTQKAFYGLFGSLLKNATIGVSEGFSKTLVLVGVGYRAQLKDNKLVLSLGYSHPVEFTPDPRVKIDCPDQTTVQVSGIDKQVVGEQAAKIRAFRPPEPYKGKGVMLKGETIKRKAGKTGKK